MPDFIFPIQDGKLINALDANGQDIADANLTGTTLLDGVAITAMLDDKLDASALDTDGTMAADSDARIASQKATRTYIASVLAGVATHKGALDCSTNPNYPTALNGDSYRCSVAGKIGGASGVVVEVADLILCVADNAGGTQASVGASWVIGQANITGITAAGLDMMQAADADAQAALLSAFFLAIDAQAADVDPAGTDIAAALGGKLDTDAQAADVDPAGTDIALALAAKLPLSGGTMDENAIVNLSNGSKWQQSTPDKGVAGDAGFSIICSVGYEYKFALGYLFILSDGSTTVRKVLYAPAAPTATDDTTLGYTTDTTWEMADGTLYECTDATATAAVWAVVPTVSAASTTTLTNKRITPRIGSTTSSATPTINTDNVDRYDLTAQAVNITSFTTNLSGTPTNGQALWISVKGTAARAITWGASFESGAATLPTTTVSTDRLDVFFVWNAVTSKWRCVLTTATHATDATKLPLAGGTMDENAIVNLSNGSKWQQSTPDKGIAGAAGFSIICSAGYEYKFALGYLFILSDNSTDVRKVLYAPSTPTATDDTTLGYTTDTTWEMQDGTQYHCTDATATAAVWEAVPGTDATKLPLAGGTMDENAVVTLFNDSKWQQSTPNKGIAGAAGFSIICSVGYEYKFANGYLFILSDGSSTVRKVLYAPAAPTATDDTTLGYTTDTTWEMADGTQYRCTDATATAAVWEVVPGTDATKLPLAGGTMDENAVVTLFNDSKWQQSTPNIGIAGAAGFSIICSAGYEYKFALGYLFILSDGSSTVRKVLYAPAAPTATDDTTLGFTTDTTWEMADGTLYECTDATATAAVWAVVPAVSATDATKLPLAGGTMTGAIGNDGVINVNIGNGNTSSGTHATAVGKSNDAPGNYSSAVGFNNTASATDSSAFGSYNDATATQSSAFGYQNTASGTRSSALGYDNTASGTYSSAVGYQNTATGNHSSAVGVSNTASTASSCAFGYNNDATGAGGKSSAFGYINTASGTAATAVGAYNTASGDQSSAFGYQNTASGSNSSALGRGNTASGNDSSAVGYLNTASSLYSSAVGYFNTASADYSSAVGTDNTASGYRSSAVGYENTASGSNSSAFGRSNDASATDSSAFGRSNDASGLYSSAFGYDNDASASSSSAFGRSNTASGNYSSAVGPYNTASANYSSAFGYQNTASGLRSSAVGSENAASGNNSSAFGYLNTASGSRSSAFGYLNTASGNYSSAVGYQNTANGHDSNAVGFLNGCNNISSIDSVTGVVTYSGGSPTYSTAGVASSMFGVGNQATGTYSSAFGYLNTASGNGSSAFGRSNIASGNYSSAVGYTNTASDSYSTAVGNQNTASATGSSAIGIFNTASGNYSSAFGYTNTASGANSSAFGYSNDATATGSSAVGRSNTASGNYSSAVGWTNTASANYSSAVGRSNTASGNDSSAVGSYNAASGNQSSAVGYSNTASGTGSSAFGYDNTASGNGSSAFGRSNNASGTYSSAVGYTNTASGNKSSAVGYYNTASAYRSSAVGYYNTASGLRSSAFGYNNTASGTYSTAFGYSNDASGYYSSAVGYNNTASGQQSSAVGYTNTASGTQSSAVGRSNNASGANSSAVGSSNIASGTYSSAVGSSNNTSGTNSSAVGVNNAASGTYSSAVGYYNTASGNYSSAVGSYVQTGTTKATELGQWDSATARNGAIRLHTTGMAALTVQNRATEYGDAAEAQTVTITRSGTTATVSLTAHGYNVGSKITVAGANEVAYNGNFTVTAVGGADVFNYTAASTPSASPATGTVTCVARLGSERDNRLARGMFAIRRDGLAFYLDYNDGGTIKNISLGTAA